MWMTIVHYTRDLVIKIKALVFPDLNKSAKVDAGTSSSVARRLVLKSRRSAVQILKHLYHLHKIIPNIGKTVSVHLFA